MKLRKRVRRLERLVEGLVRDESAREAAETCRRLLMRLGRDEELRARIQDAVGAEGERKAHRVAEPVQRTVRNGVVVVRGVAYHAPLLADLEGLRVWVEVPEGDGPVRVMSPLGEVLAVITEGTPVCSPVGTVDDEG